MCRGAGKGKERLDAILYHGLERGLERGKDSSVRGRYVERVSESDPSLYAPARYRRACRYSAFVPEPLNRSTPTLSGLAAGTVSDAEQTIADLNRIAGRELDPFARLLLRTESIASSKVEGLQLDARTLARAEANQETGRRVGREAAEIIANIDAMQAAIERATDARDVTVDDLVAIHAVLMENAPNRHVAGRVRTVQNWIGGNDYNPCDADFVPPPEDEVGRLLDDLATFCNDDGLPPLVQAAVAHAQFETIHPFEDGNGRVGRALIQVILRRRKLAYAVVPPISIIWARDKARYLAGLTSFRTGLLDDWLEMFAVAARRAAELAAWYADRVSELQSMWRERLKRSSNPRADAAAWAIIDILPAHPVIMVSVAVAATGRTKPAVTNGIRSLEAAGILHRLSESDRNRAWEADGLLDLLVGLEGGAE
jgi:Fic family protein